MPLERKGLKIVLAGGTGQIGTLLARAFHKEGNEVTVLSRSTRPAPWKVAGWDGVNRGTWVEHLEGADVVINLAGRSVNCRYGAKNRRLIMDSRVQSTRALGEAIRGCQNPPRVWLQMSTATIYAHRYDAANTEASGILGGDEPNAPETWRFSIEVAKAWEEAAREFVIPATRKVLLRSAIVMSADRGGAFDILLRLVRCGLGGKAGDGRQYVSWIHEEDFVRAVQWIIEHEEISGVVNLAAPGPLPNDEFMRELRRAWGRGFGLPAAEWMLEVGAFFLRTETELILKSRRVTPGRLVTEGFPFRFPKWAGAARALCEARRK